MRPLDTSRSTRKKCPRHLTLLSCINHKPKLNESIMKTPGFSMSVLRTALALVLAPSSLQAQSQPGSLDTSFQLVKMYVGCLAADGSSIIEDVALTGDGKILVGGNFESG